MKGLSAIAAYTPINEQEAMDKELILSAASLYSGGILQRENRLCHITSSAMIVDTRRTHALLIHHLIRDCWAWTGGHVDGEEDFLAVAIREAMEETGAETLRPIDEGMASVDVLTVSGHMKNGAYVSSHLHLSVAYVLEGNRGEPLRIKPDENSGVKWFPLADFTPANFSARDLYLYQKLLNKA